MCTMAAVPPTLSTYNTPLPSCTFRPTYSQMAMHTTVNLPILNTIPGVHTVSPPVTTVPPIKPRRGRRSAVPPEQREQTRRLKKQNMERRRRASISDKMNALHSLAMDIIGLDPHAQQKVEKADILNTCYKVFEGIAKIARDEPEIQARLRKLRSQIPESRPGTSLSVDENTQSSVYSDDSVNNPVSDRLSPPASLTDRENQFFILPDAVLKTVPNLPSCQPTPCDGSHPGWHSTFASWGSSDSGIHTSRDSLSDRSIGIRLGQPICPSENGNTDPDGLLMSCRHTMDDRPRPFKPRHQHPMLRRPLAVRDINQQHQQQQQQAKTETGLSASHISAFKIVRPEVSISPTVWRPYL
ncbi:STARP antigen [Paragonimus kellicotti]|nr:STARP antigen [Paragonimus kellicotti]